ncbi:hypothetical protein AB685_11060 [Bacillus sp. LL01]|uniref:GNAT family N-acetyltransferase n=1 Tax=Bacillus sp. LL01 TaxID=1665556 RepID=UPI00064D383F|nr:GNAT family N-acetyltransferase [Bacillus sp. LL01]KMJ58422.1 hypothetical protein AB685_11060 [Bacillus sp. LL01]
MFEIRELHPGEFGSFVEIASNAYPGMSVNTDEEKQALLERLEKQTQNSDKRLFGCFKNNLLVGGMLLHNFLMNFHSQQMQVGGLGFVCVDLLHKKEKVAKYLVTYFEEYYRERHVPITALYPFRPDFYRRMGYGYGTKMNKFRFRPDQLPILSKKDVVLLTEKDASELFCCYERYMLKTHGMMARSIDLMKALFQNPKVKVYGVKDEEAIMGYCSFTFESEKQGNFLSNNILIKELITETPAALQQLVAFLRSQQDQVANIILHTQESDFHYLLQDPRNGTDNIMPHVYHESHTSAVGLMYKVLDLKKVIEAATYGLESISVVWKVEDTFMPNFNSSVYVQFKDGRANVLEKSNAEVSVDISISDFSSLIMGAVSFSSLHHLGLLRVSDESKLGNLHNLFSGFTKPVCLTAF